MAENIHLLTKEIRASSDATLFPSHYTDRLTALLSVFSSNSIYFKKAIREYNKKLQEFNLSSEIIGPVDGGLRPLNDNFFGTLLAAKSQSNVNFPSSPFHISWDADRRGANVRQDVQRSANYSIRLFHEGSGLVASFPAKFSVQFDVTQNSGSNINTTSLIAGGGFSSGNYSNVTTRPLFLSFRDDDATDESPDFNNKSFAAITTGFNSFNVELFDDGDPSKPSISIIVHRKNVNLDVDIKNIKIRELP